MPQKHHGRRHFCLGLAAGCLARPGLAGETSLLQSARPQTSWPQKPVRIITPFPAGGGPDGTARLLADILARRWQQSVVVENRPGGNGFIAIQAFLRGSHQAHADILQLDNVHLSAYPHLFRKLPYDVQRDFAFVLPLFRASFFVCVAANSPWHSVADLIAAARARPGALNYGSWSVGNPAHLGAALLEMLTDTRMQHVVYRETGQLYASVATGELDFAFGTLATAGPLVRAGRLRFLAVVAPGRLSVDPEIAAIPTLAESGGPPEALISGLNTFVVARQTAPEIIDKIRLDTTAALREAVVQEKFRAFGYENYFPGVAEFQAFMQEESRRLGDLIARLGLTL